MNRKAFWRTIWAFAIAIAIVSAVWAALPSFRSRPYTAVLIPKTGESGFEFWESVEEGAQESAREYGVELEVTGPENEADIEGQIRLIYEAIERKPDMILLAPCDMDALEEAAQAVHDAGIALILLDCELQPSVSARVADCIVGIENEEAAELLAEEMASDLEGSGKVAILAPTPNASSVVHRIDGIERTLSKYPDITIVEVARCGVTVDEAEQSAKRILEEHPDIAGVLGVNPVCSEGAAMELKDRPEHVYLYAFDTSASHNEYLEEGIVDGFVAQIAFNLGYLSVESGYLACRNELCTNRMDSGYVYATRENMRDEAIQKLIYPT